MKAIIRWLDQLISRCYRVEEFTDDPDCLLRLSPGRTSHLIFLPDGDFPAGTPVVMIHYWNERMPPLPAAGADLTYARLLNRRQIHSLWLMARYIQSEPEYADAQLVGGMTILAPTGVPDGGTAMLRHYGFTVIPYHSPLGHFGEFWENLFTWSLMWTYNPASLRGRPLWSLSRSELWMSVKAFKERYAGNH
jgi:hypothetical protein